MQNLPHSMVNAIRKKAQEVSFVLLKIAGYIRHKELAARIESISYKLIESLYSDDLDTATKCVESAIGLTSLASNIGEMSAGNTAIVLRELENLKNGIKEHQETREVKEMPSVEGLFSRLTIAAPARAGKNQIAPRLPNQKSVNGSEPIDTSRKNENSPQLIEQNGSALIRQNDIMAKIKAAIGSKLQLRDIIAAFPHISERTLRYDLVKLCQIGKLRREGAGGPSNYYVASTGVAGLPDSTGKSSTNPAQNSSSMGVMNNSPMSL